MEIRDLKLKECRTFRFRYLEALLSFTIDDSILKDSNGIKLGVFEDNKLIGFAIGYKVTYTNIFELAFLVIRPEYQGSGIGKKLITEFENKVREKDETVLQVGTMWKFGVRRFYRKMGYKIFETDKESRCTVFEKRLISTTQ